MLAVNGEALIGGSWWNLCRQSMVKPRLVFLVEPVLAVNGEALIGVPGGTCGWQSMVKP